LQALAVNGAGGGAIYGAITGAILVAGIETAERFAVDPSE
jgi:hypothetical protein